MEESWRVRIVGEVVEVVEEERDSRGGEGGRSTGGGFRLGGVGTPRDSHVRERGIWRAVMSSIVVTILVVVVVVWCCGCFVSVRVS